jgi:hypothetical protein
MRRDERRSEAGLGNLPDYRSRRHPKTANRFTIQLAAPIFLATALLLAMIVEWALSIE